LIFISEKQETKRLQSASSRKLCSLFMSLSLESLQSIDYDNEHLLGGVVQMLLRNESGEAISCERLPYVTSVALWAKLLKDAGLYVNFNESDFIEFHEIGEQQEMPVLVVNQLNTDTDLVEGVYTLYKNQVQTPSAQYSGSLAEAVFHDIEKKDFLKGIQVNFIDGSGKLRYELWTSGEMLTIYQVSNIGYRQLNAMPVDNISEMQDELIESIQSQYMGRKIIPYDTIQARDSSL
jgi:hypothetical protein